METSELLIFSCVLLVTLGPPVVDDLALQGGHLSLYGGQYGVSYGRSETDVYNERKT